MNTNIAKIGTRESVKIMKILKRFWNFGSKFEKNSRHLQNKFPIARFDESVYHPFIHLQSLSETCLS